MAIEKLTLFELHFEDAQFGPRSFGTDAAGDEADLDEGTADVEAAETTDSPADVEESDGGPRFLALFAASAAVAIAATIVARRLFGGDEQTTVDDFAEEPADAEETIEVEGEDVGA